MRGHVDVLAVMDRDAEHAAAYRLAHGYADGPLTDPASDAIEARAVVAELIESHRALLDWHALKRSGDLKQILKQARAALARLSGAPQ